MARRRTSIPDDCLNMATVADVIGVQVRTLRRPKFRKLLPVEHNPITGHPYIRRGELLKWLVANGFPDEVKRRLIMRREAPVLALGLPPEARQRWRSCGLSTVAGPVSLGQRLLTTPPRAVLFGLDWPGAVAVAMETKAADDRPVMVAVSRAKPPAGVFDDTVHPDAPAGAVQKLLAAVPVPPLLTTRRVS